MDAGLDSMDTLELRDGPASSLSLSLFSLSLFSLSLSLLSLSLSLSLSPSLSLSLSLSSLSLSLSLSSLSPYLQQRGGERGDLVVVRAALQRGEDGEVDLVLELVHGALGHARRRRLGAVGRSIQVNSRTHVPQGLMLNFSMYQSGIDLSVPIQTVPQSP
jgi:hypothetical protein